MNSGPSTGFFMKGSCEHVQIHQENAPPPTFLSEKEVGNL
jgi:hypothetical protein